MSGIAEVLMNLGYSISGSDLAETDITRRLASLGGKISKGHDADLVQDADVVVVSSAIQENNPEVQAARAMHIPVIPRATMLAELMRLKKFGVAIAGSHGKTSTTSLVGWILAQAGLDPTVVIGGKVNSLGSNAKLGEGDFLVAEADESDGSFLQLSPVLEVVTNIDREHLDYYDGIEDIKDAYLAFMEKIPFYGTVILCLDDPHITDLLPEFSKRVTTYGLSHQADIQARNVSIQGFKTQFEVFAGEDLLGTVSLNMPGQHWVLNTLAAITVGLELEVSFTVIADALQTFTGVQRRVQIKGELNNVTVVDDYGHHPTEVKATISALREAWPDRRLIVLFQPHRYSRTQALFREFCTAFHGADLLYLTEIYAASEEPIPNVTGIDLVEGIKKHGQRHVQFVEQISDLPKEVISEIKTGDVILTLGAGSIWQTGEKLLDLMSGEN